MNAFDYFFENTSSLAKPFLKGKEEISFTNLHTYCIALAGAISKNTEPKSHIMLLSVNNLFFLKTYFAIIKSGNICVPLDPFIEKENFDYIREMTQPGLIFATRDIGKRLDLDTDSTIFPDTINEFAAKYSGINIEQVDSESCAEIIFTSGSTGKPKGVMISHRNLIANTGSIVEYLKLNYDDRMLVVLPFYYCYGLSLLHTHLRVGGSIVLNNSFIFLGEVIKNLLEFKCTGFAGVPSHFQILLRRSDSFIKTSFPYLRYVTQAGGKLAPVFIDEFRKAQPGIKFIVMYGQTEATARLSWLQPELNDIKRGSIGKGIPGVELKVVKENGAEIQPGETGEVIARGNNIMIGYLADQVETKKTIRNGWLYTGDLGTIDEEGFIFLIARSKEIIKVGGKRISPKEIEAVILQLPDVIDCTVEGIEDPILGETLKAIVVIREGGFEKINTESIKQHCSKHLALYKIPQTFDLRRDLSINPTGKKIKKKVN